MVLMCNEVASAIMLILPILLNTLRMGAAVENFLFSSSQEDAKTAGGS
jgi:hypothetical protein